MRIGIYGGSFSPVHSGHVAAAKAFMEQMWLDLLYIVPAGIPPHKQIAGGADAWQRLKMCELAFADMEGVVISDMEIRREGPSYTVDTLRQISHMCDEDSRLFLLMGTDMLLTLDRWVQPEEIFRLSYPVYMRREGNDPILDSRIVAKIGEYQQKYGKVVRRIVGDPVVVSSTQVRRAIAEGRSIDGMVPPAVAAYIRDHNLYV
ncbi:MAG: nicotinate (nicotinamide) nucleotide adenylyltransferase [Clostridia bacterium]|nr:nicotinate (nicotinamide) nucleotide adenylyltransferase [Clostridia bacterium]